MKRIFSIQILDLREKYYKGHHKKDRHSKHRRQF